MLSGFLSVCSKGHIDIGNSVLVKTFMRGVFNKRPALPKYITRWNPAQVLKYLESLGSELTFLQLSQKVCRLLHSIYARFSIVSNLLLFFGHCNSYISM